MTDTEAQRTIAIAAEDDQGFDGEVSHHFGRCPYYFLVRVRDDHVVDTNVVPNPGLTNHQPGQMPLVIRDLGADVIVAGGMGPRAIGFFQQFGIEVATGAVGNARQAFEAYLRGEIKGIVPCAHDHPDSCGGHRSGGS